MAARGAAAAAAFPGEIRGEFVPRFKGSLCALARATNRRLLASRLTGWLVGWRAMIDTTVVCRQTATRCAAARRANFFFRSHLQLSPTTELPVSISISF